MEKYCVSLKLCANIGNTNNTHLNHILLILGPYSPPIKTLSKKKRAVIHGRRKTRELTLMHDEVHIVEFNDYLDIFLDQRQVKKSERYN